MSSTLTQTLISTLHLIPDWISRLLEDSENEAESHQSWTIKMVEGEARKVVWNICALVGVGGKGVPGLACRLLEQYLAAAFQKRGQIEPCEFELGENEDWDEFLELLSKELPLLIATCAQLAAKMSSVSAIVDLRNVSSALMQRNLNYSLQDIINAEFKVLSMLDYRIPLWTSLETAELLAVEVGIPLRGIHVVGSVINMAEYYRSKVDKRVQWAAVGSPASNTEPGLPIRTLHLSAGAVAASCRVLSYDLPSPVPRLANLTRVPSSYIKCIADCILDCILGCDDD